MRLRDAIEAADLAAVRVALVGGESPDGPGPDGETPLMLAAARGRIGIVRALTRAGARPEREGPDGATALLRAAEHGRRAVFDLLLPLVPSRQRARPRRLLKKATLGPDARSGRLRDAGRADEVAEFVRSDLAVDAPGADGLTPLYLACARGDHVVARLLANGGADPDILLDDPEARRREGALIFSWTPLMAAARLGHAAVLRALLDAGASANPWPREAGPTPLGQAVDRGHLAVVEELLRRGADPVSQIGPDLGGPQAQGDERRQRIFDLLREAARKARPGRDFARRGGVEGFDADIALVFAEAPIDAVSEAMARRSGLGLRRDVAERLPTPEGPCFLVFRLRGQEWTGIAPLVPRDGDPVARDDLGRELSEALGTRTVSFAYAEFLNHVAYAFHEAGERTESFAASELATLRGGASAGRAFASKRREVAARELERELDLTQKTFQGLNLFVPVAPPPSFRPGDSFRVAFPGYSPEDFERVDALVT